MSTTPRASVVIPAHNEETVIARCLAALARGVSRPESLEVVVVANGCDDSTARVARAFEDRLPALRVVERSAPGKIGALNEGDRHVGSFPRIYLDADIELGVGALEGLVETLTTDRPVIGSPSVRFDVDDSSKLVRGFYRVFTALPYAVDTLVGLGVYGFSSSGRARFDTFPEVIADDLFVQRLFAPSERLRCPGTFTVRAPRSFGALLRVRTRVARGNAELSRAGQEEMVPGIPSTATLDSTPSTDSTVRALASLLGERPATAADVATYVAVTACARLRARRSASAWLRDDSTRR